MGLVGRHRNNPNPHSDWTFKSQSGLENYEVTDGTVLFVVLLIVVVPGVEWESSRPPTCSVQPPSLSFTPCPPGLGDRARAAV